MIRLPLACVAVLCIGSTSAAQNEPPEVQVVKPVSRVVTDYEPVTGVLEPSARVELRARMTGFLVRIHFKDGSRVRKGDLLFEIDSRQAQAQLKLAEAHLAQSEAGYRAMKVNLDRAMNLVSKAAISREEVDKIQSDVIQLAATIESSKIQVDLARLNLEHSRVLSPIDGVIGQCLVSAGNLVRADETLLATVLSVDPIHFRFALKEPVLLRLRKRLQGGQTGPTATNIALGLMDEVGFPRQGTIDFVDNQIDPKTKTCHIRGTLANAEGLISGLSIRGQLNLGQPYQAILIPKQTHFVRFKDGDGVYKIKDNKLVTQAVELGSTFEDLVVVKSGLTPEDRVVLVGPGPGSMLQEGLLVRPKLAAAPE